MDEFTNPTMFILQNLTICNVRGQCGLYSGNFQTIGLLLWKMYTESAAVSLMRAGKTQ